MSSMRRKVIVYEMKWSVDTKRYDRTKPGTGIFHQFGLRIEEDDRGFTNESVAIVELDDGNIITPRADLIQFVKDEASLLSADLGKTGSGGINSGKRSGSWVTTQKLNGRTTLLTLGTGAQKLALLATTVMPNPGLSAQDS